MNRMFGLKLLIGKLYILAILCSFLISCNQKQSNPEIEVYKIDMEHADEVSIYDICSHIELVPLENSDSVLLSIIYPMLYGNCYYVKQNNPQQVTVFDSVGGFKYKIDNLGQGAGEYKSLSDIAVNPFSQSFYLLEDLDQLNEYDLNGHFQQKIRFNGIPEILNGVFPLNRDTLVVISGRDHCVYSFFSIKENRVIARINDRMPMVGTPKPMFYSDNQLYRYTWYDNVVYKVQDTCFVPAFCLDFGKFNNLKEDYSKFDRTFKNDSELEAFVLKHNIIIDKIQSNPDYLYIMLNHLTKDEPQLKQVLYDKKTKKSLVFENFKERVFWNFFGFLTDGAFVGCINAANKEELLDSGLLDEKNKRVYEGIKPDDNPIMVVFKLK